MLYIDNYIWVTEYQRVELLISMNKGILCCRFMQQMIGGLYPIVITCLASERANRHMHGPWGNMHVGSFARFTHTHTLFFLLPRACSTSIWSRLTCGTKRMVEKGIYSDIVPLVTNLPDMYTKLTVTNKKPGRVCWAGCKQANSQTQRYWV